MPDDAVIDTLKFGIGQPVLRTEDPKLLTGRGEFTDDYSADGQAYCAFFRSPVAHGSIISIDTSAAEAAPGVIAIITGKDLRDAGVKDIPCPISVKSRDGSAAVVPPRPAMAVGQVKHVGDPVAAVIAETSIQARDAAEMIILDTENLPSVSDPVAAEKNGAPQVWEEAPGNTCLDFQCGDNETVEKAFADAAHITKIELTNTRVIVSAMEPRATVAEYDRGTEKFTLHVGTQGVAGYRGAMCNMLDIEPDKMRIISKEVGGSFGMKGSAFNEAIVVLHASRVLGRPVKWTADRSESFLSDHHGRAMTFELGLALDKDGNFLALRVDGVGDMGAYLTSMGPWPATMVTSRNIISVYKTPAISYNAKCIFTNTVPTGPYRGAGRPESKFFMERLIDKAAEEMGIDRVELRRLNLISPDMLPHETPIDLTYDSGEFETIMDLCLERADYAGYNARKKESETAGMIRGFGVAPYLETTAGPGTELADIRFEDDGTVTLVTGNKDFGMGHATPFAQVLSTKLGIPFEAINLVQYDSDEMSTGAGGSGGSRSMIAASGAILECAETIIENGKKLAGHVLEAAVEDIEFTDGVFTVVGTDRNIGIMTLSHKARELDGAGDLPANLSHKVNHDTAPISFPNGCHIAEVEIDPDTGVVAIDRYTVVDDFGVVVNPLIVEGQVHGGIAQGIGQVLAEDTIYDDEGQLMTGTYLDYQLPRADDIAHINFTTHAVPCKTNPLGVKGCGEAGNGGSYPVIYNAIMDALDGNGGKELGIPATPHRIWQAIRQRGLGVG
ncbi:MAG: xanthine dehydrogenase family protein molybdopterin-binding subunit [Pseudomonadota bacterium]|nr:xanthine dehydrogenase family protein molybdopterin-binding subunit [Pseudomonadota bacterium]